MHDHSFVGADYPLDDSCRPASTSPRARSLAASRRRALAWCPIRSNRSANSLTFALQVSNVGTGHNLPGGFAFVRQMWLEVSLLDAAGALLDGSGRVANGGRRSVRQLDLGRSAKPDARLR